MTRLDTSLKGDDGWQPIDNNTPDTVHFRGLYVRVNRAGFNEYYYWDCCAGFIDDMTGEWKTLSGDDCGWNADDFTHWSDMPKRPEAPKT